MGGVRGYKQNFKGLITEFINHIPKLDPNSPAYAGDLRLRQGIIPDFCPPSDRGVVCFN